MFGRLVPLVLLVLVGAGFCASRPPHAEVEGDRRVLRSASGYQTVSMLDGGRTGLYYDLGDLVGRVRPEAQRVVLLGLGGGEMLRAARRTLPNAELVGVELSPSIAHLARTDFGMDALGVKVVVQNAAQYVAEMPFGSADALIVDVYDDYRLPDYFQSEAFFRGCRRGLSGQGILLMNVWPSTLAPSISQAMLGAGFRTVSAHWAMDNVVLVAEL